jgi:hypothetical protein
VIKGQARKQTARRSKECESESGALLSFHRNDKEALLTAMRASFDPQSPSDVLIKVDSSSVKAQRIESATARASLFVFPDARFTTIGRTRVSVLA